MTETSQRRQGAEQPVAADASAVRIEIERTGWHHRGAWYRVWHDGKVLIERSRDPAFDACRALLARGVTGTMCTYFPGGTVARMRLDIVRAAEFCASETKTQGPRIARWRSYPTDGAGDDDVDSGLLLRRVANNRGANIGVGVR